MIRNGYAVVKENNFIHTYLVTGLFSREDIKKIGFRYHFKRRENNNEELYECCDVIPYHKEIDESAAKIMLSHF